MEKHLLLFLLLLIYAKSNAFNLKDTTMYYKTTQQLNVREYPNTKGKIIQSLEAGCKIDAIYIDSLGENWTKIRIDNYKFGYINSHYIKQNIIIKYNQNLKNTFFILLAILLVFYIIAIIKSWKGSNIQVVIGWLDIVLCILPIILVGVFALIKYKWQIDLWIYCWILIAINILYSLYITIINNKDSANLTIAILAKLFIYCIDIIVVFGIIWSIITANMKEEKKDARFRTGYKNNEDPTFRRLAQFLSIILLFLFVLPMRYLVKDKEGKFLFMED